MHSTLATILWFLIPLVIFFNGYFSGRLYHDGKNVKFEERIKNAPNKTELRNSMRWLKTLSGVVLAVLIFLCWFLSNKNQSQLVYVFATLGIVVAVLPIEAIFLSRQKGLGQKSVK